MEDWKEEQLLRQQQGDFRAYQIVSAVLEVRNAWVRGGGSVPEPGRLFPSLKDLELRDDDGEDVDPELSYQQIRSAFSRFER